MTEIDLDAIQARKDAATPGPWGTYRDLAGVYTIQARPRTTIRHGHEHDGDIATLATDRADAESYANAHFITHAPQDIDALVAENRRLRARVRELERPAIEAKRDEIRQSFTELIAAAEETKDYEGAFDVQCRLREREEQWKAEDAANQPTAPAVRSDAADGPDRCSGCRYVPCGECAAPAVRSDAV